MNNFDLKYEIRLARINEIHKIMKFISKYWKENHILSTDEQLFKYEFFNRTSMSINMVVAIDRSDGEIAGIYGFLPASSCDTPDIWGSIWTVKKTALPLLGIELVKRLPTLFPHRFNLGIGINRTTTALIRKFVFREDIFAMNHYYILNPNISDFEIANIRNKTAFSPPKGRRASISLLETIEEVKHFFTPEPSLIPHKDYSYIEKRFFLHPLRKYRVFGISDELTLSRAAFVVREECYELKKALRILDFLGDVKTFPFLKDFFVSEFSEHNYEYIDFYNLGIDVELVQSSGLTLRRLGDENIIPNYFSPFVRENIDIYVRTPVSTAIFMKADGDQDRPN